MDIVSDDEEAMVEDEEEHSDEDVDDITFEDVIDYEQTDLSDEYYIIKAVLLVRCITSSLISTYLVGTQV